VPLSPSKGRAPYLHILNWLANAESWTLDLRDAIRNNPDLRGSVGQVLDNLAERELEVFYDKNEQHRMLARDVEEYLRPIYQSEAQFVVVLLGRDYPKRIWTKIESEAFQARFSEGAVGGYCY
jgi:hypothetical protein